MQVTLQATLVDGLFVAKDKSCLHLVTSNVEYADVDEEVYYDWLGQIDDRGNYATVPEYAWSVDIPELVSDYSNPAPMTLVNEVTKGNYL